MAVHPLAGKPVPDEMIPDIETLLSAYSTLYPDPAEKTQQVTFGTSGHRGSSLSSSFNETHILAITQAICDYRLQEGITGPLFMGQDTHALSAAAFDTALEVLCANGVDVCIQTGPGTARFTPTPVISHAILKHNAGHSRQADGIIITPSHNPPTDGGLKYNPPTGGPANTSITTWIERRANDIIRARLKDVKRMQLAQARKQAVEFDFRSNYVDELDQVVDMQAISAARLKIGVDPLGGSGIAYWEPIAEKFGLDLTLVHDQVDPAFSFMRIDKDGRIRMDCSSPWAMAGLLELKDRFDIAFGNDPDFDRHGIVTRYHGLLNPNHFLAVAIWYLFQNRPQWPGNAAIGKTLVSSAFLDKIAACLGRELYEVPVGFKWFVDGLLDGSLAFGGEESAGASFLRLNGQPWSTDKDGIIMDLLAAEITARQERDPGDLYLELTERFGSPVYERSGGSVSLKQAQALKQIDPVRVGCRTLAGEKIDAVLTRAPGNDANIGGLKVITPSGWFAVRPSGTEPLYKLYTESFLGEEHLRLLQKDAQKIIDRILADS